VVVELAHLIVRVQARGKRLTRDFFSCFVDFFFFEARFSNMLDSIPPFS